MNSNVKQALDIAHVAGYVSHKTKSRLHNIYQPGSIEHWAWDMGWRLAKHISDNRA